MAVLRNIDQYVVNDNENQTAHLKLPNEGYWWSWYGSEIETHAFYLKLLARTDPKGDLAPRLVKYLLNNRRHGSYWNSTRDTAFCVEAMADYLKARGEDRPDMTVAIAVDGQPRKEVRITPADLFQFDNGFVLEGQALSTGEHTVTLTRRGKGPVYFNAYLINFTMEDPIARAGLEIKVDRKIYRLVKDDRAVDVAGARGQAVGQRVERYRREPMADGATSKSGDLVEIELQIDSKNDYEYLVFEDYKAAGFEPVEVQSGYNGNDLGAYVEFRDERVAFFARTLARGTRRGPRPVPRPARAGICDVCAGAAGQLGGDQARCGGSMRPIRSGATGDPIRSVVGAGSCRRSAGPDRLLPAIGRAEPAPAGDRPGRIGPGRIGGYRRPDRSGRITSP